MKKKLKENLLKAILIIPIAYLALLFIIFIFQRNLLYHPNENNYFGDELKVKIEKVKIKTSDNIELLGWYYEKDLKNLKTLVFFHGNAGTLENRIHKINHFKDMNINFLIVSWRGFSGNSGKPSEKGLYKDGESAINWLKGKGLKDTDIVLYGESIGTGIVTHIAQNYKFAGVILESPFTSMVDAAKNVYPYFPIRFLLKDKYESDKKSKKSQFSNFDYAWRSRSDSTILDG